MRDIGKNIRDLRQQSRLTQDELAERLFVTRQTISNYENGRTRPDVDQILRLAEVFGTDANAVLYGPPVLPSRKSAVIHAVVGVGLCALLWAVYFALQPWVAYWIKRNLHLLSSLVLAVCWKPVMLGMTGWTLTQLLLLFIPMKLPQTTGIRRARQVFLILALCGILLPLLACLLIYSGHYNGFAFWLRQFFGQIIYFSIKAAFVYPFVGVTLGLLGFPAGKAAPANAPESPIQPH